MEKLTSKLGHGVNYLSADAISSVAWAFATVGYHCDSDLMHEMIGTFFAKVRKELAPMSLATFAVGLAGLGWREASSWHKLCAVATRMLPQMDASGLHQLIWAFATAGFYDAEFCSSVAAACLDQLDGFAVEELVNLVWSFTALGHEDTLLFDQVAKLMVACIERDGQAASSSRGGSHRVSRHVGQLRSDHVKQTIASASCSSSGSSGGQSPHVLSSEQYSSHSPAHTSRCSYADTHLGLEDDTTSDQASTSEQHWQSQQYDSGLLFSSPALQGQMGHDVSWAYETLEKYDPVLCTMILYRDYFQVKQPQGTDHVLGYQLVV
eukprot:jgi/Chrzof1/1666/Cz10g16140.t1